MLIYRFHFSPSISIVHYLYDTYLKENYLCDYWFDLYLTITRRYIDWEEDRGHKPKRDKVGKRIVLSCPSVCILFYRI